jgi:PAS domain S-box-containing protein
MGFVLNSWDAISRSGISEGENTSDTKRIKLTNRLGIIAVFFTLPYLIGFFYFGYYQLALFLCMLSLIYSCTPLLSKYRLFNAAKLTLYCTVLVHQFVVASIFGEAAGVHLMYLALVLLPIVIYDYKKDILWLIFYFSITIVALLILYYTDFSLLTINASASVQRWMDISYKITTMAGVVVILVSSLYVTESNEKLLDSDNLFLQHQLKAIFDNSHDALFLVDSDKRAIIKANTRASELFEMSQDELIGKFGPDLHKIYPTEKERQVIRMALATAGNFQAEVNYKTGTGGEFWGSLAIRVISIKGKRFEVVRITDITAQHAMNEKLKASLQEKEVLLAEIHHRVKNNLAVVSGLLGLQATYITNEQARAMFEESRNRIHSMALIHHKLYQHESFAQIDFAAYINDLISHIRDSYNNSEATITFNITCNDIYIDIKNAVPCGLIMNELISNAYKHAFPGRSQGEIKIVCTKMGEKFTMMVSDNGIGFDMSTELEKPRSLGLTLITALADQLSGSVRATHHQGTAFYLSFEV